MTPSRRTCKVSLVQDEQEGPATQRTFMLACTRARKSLGRSIES